MKKKNIVYVVIAVFVCFLIAFGPNIKQEAKIWFSEDQEVIDNKKINISVTDLELHQNSFKYANYIASNQFVNLYVSSSRLNLNNLKIGDEIVRYIVKDNQLIIDTNSFIYPIINNNTQCGKVVVYVNENEFVNYFGFKEKLDNSQLFAYFDDKVEYHELDNIIINNTPFAYLSTEDSFYIITKNDVIYQENEKESDLKYIEKIQNNLNDRYEIYKINKDTKLDVKDIHIIKNELSEKKLNTLIKEVNKHYENKKECGKLIESWRYVINKDLSITLIKDYDYVFFTAIEGGGFHNRLLIVSKEGDEFYLSSQENMFFNQFYNVQENILLRSFDDRIDLLSFTYKGSLSGYKDNVIDKINEKLQNEFK